MNNPPPPLAVGPLLAIVCSLTLGGVSSATELTDMVTVRRSVGVVFLAGSAALAAQGFEYHDEADVLFAEYKAAVDPEEIERLYQRTTNRDVKSQVSWAVATAFAISGARLILTGGKDETNRDERRLAAGSAQRELRASARSIGRRGHGGRFLRLTPRFNRVGTVGFEIAVPFN